MSSNDERYDRHAKRHEDGSKGFIAVTGPRGRRPFFFWSPLDNRCAALDAGVVLWDTGAQEGHVERNGGENFSRNTVSSLNGARRNQSLPAVQ